MMNCTSLCLVYHCPTVMMDHSKVGNRYSALFSPGRFCFLLYHAPSSGDFSSAISSSSSSNTSSAVGERKDRGGGGLSVNFLWFCNTTNTHTHGRSHTVSEMSLTCFADPLQVSGELSLDLLLPPKLQELLPLLHTLSLFGKFSVETQRDIFYTDNE